LALIIAAGLALRLAYLWFSRKGACDFDLPQDRPAGCAGDSYVYHFGARLLAEGKGFIVPTDYIVSDGAIRKAGADHPPLYTLLLAAVSLLGGTSWFAHELVSVVIGTASVVVAGVLGRMVAGERAGLLAAGAVALYPYVWLNDALVLSEGLSILLVLVLVALAYRYWWRASWLLAAGLGLAVGAVALTRAEGLLFGPLLVVPLILRAPGLPWRQRLTRLTAATAAAVLAVLPWAAYNLSRFEHPVTLSTGFGITLSNANCDDTYYGAGLGFWSFACIGPLPWTQTRAELSARDDGELRQLAEWSGVEVPPASTTGQVITAILAKADTADQSDDELFLRRKGMHYIGEHQRRLPVVVAARLGRVWNVYRPFQMTHLDVDEGRPLWASRLALATYPPVMLLAAAGAVALWRRRTPVWPLLTPAVVVVLAVTITFGQTRYRTTAEGALAVLAALGLDAALPRKRRWPRQRAAAITAPSQPSGGRVE
jgi:4-amino-4-deoxy-L-arabinose transferase-like glycosyltransferase